MRTFNIPTRIEDETHVEQEIRSFLKQWVGLLANRKFAEAIHPLSPEIPVGSGSVSSSKVPTWTPSLLEAVIANYGTPEPLPDVPPMQVKPFAVVPLDSALIDAFEENISIDFDREAISSVQSVAIAPEGTGAGELNAMGWVSRKLSFLTGKNIRPKPRKHWLGGAEFALPLNFERGNDLSDLSARMRFKPVGSGEMVMVLLDIHVL